ncbi:hypothetical protein VPH35_041436 [Triticum aestivum]|uniref:DUF3615 domain-containing protein n=1 Tax=Aegilops tauschii subsp. strangulata TaxID=200361 RepID=A0A453DJG1_AEGTS|nr:uncharacterized protein LOC123050757 [Triticum aestivum]
MGSLFSSPAAVSTKLDYGRPLSVQEEHIARSMSKEMLASIQKFLDRPKTGVPLFTQEEMVASRISVLVDLALEHYNSNNPDAEFEYPARSTTEMNAACIGFRGTFWYHLGFTARPMDATAEKQQFFAELYFDRHSNQLAVETCTILKKPLCCFTRTCAFCPDESKILHPSHEEFVCGKQVHEKEFFRKRDMLMRHLILL